MAERKLPIGVQSFEIMRENGYVYVDKTAYMDSLIKNGRQYFLSRPRRFGKSLLLSTLKAFFEGRKDLFQGLKIEELEEDNPLAWEKYPVFYFDFNTADFERENALEKILDDHLKSWEAIYGDEYKDDILELRFQHLLTQSGYKPRLS